MNQKKRLHFFRQYTSAVLITACVTRCGPCYLLRSFVLHHTTPSINTRGVTEAYEYIEHLIVRDSSLISEIRFVIRITNANDCLVGIDTDEEWLIDGVRECNIYREVVPRSVTATIAERFHDNSEISSMYDDVAAIVVGPPRKNR